MRELEMLYERKLAKESQDFEDLKADYDKVVVRGASRGELSVA